MWRCRAIGLQHTRTFLHVGVRDGLACVLTVDHAYLYLAPIRGLSVLIRAQLAVIKQRQISFRQLPLSTLLAVISYRIEDGQSIFPKFMSHTIYRPLQVKARRCDSASLQIDAL